MIKLKLYRCQRRLLWNAIFIVREGITLNDYISALLLGDRGFAYTVNKSD